MREALQVVKVFDDYSLLQRIKSGGKLNQTIGGLVMTTTLDAALGRRRFLGSVIALALLAAMPQRSRADGGAMTGLAAAAAVADIVGAGISLVSAIMTSNKLAEISAKLDRVIGLQYEILADLRALRVYFDESQMRHWQEITTTTIAVQHNRFSIRIDDDLTPQLANELTAISNDVQNAAFTLTHKFGLAAYVSYASAVALDILLYRKLGKTPAQLAKLTKEYASALRNRWLRPAGADSVYTLIVELQKTEAERRKVLNEKPRRYLLSTRVERRNYRCEQTVETWTTVSGSIEAGFSATNEEIRGKEDCLPPDHCRGKGCLNDVDLRTLLNRPGFARTAKADSDEPELPSVPNYSDSGNQFLNEFNQMRVAYFESKRSLVAAEYLRNAMERLAAQLETAPAT